MKSASPFSHFFRSSSAAKLALFGLVVGFSLGNVSQVWASRNGTPSATALNNTVFFLGDKMAKSVATGFAVAPRCILSAHHGLKPAELVMEGGQPFTDVDLTTARAYKPGNRTQDIKDKDHAKPYVPRVRDFGVAWLTDFKHAAAKPRIVKYSPLKINAVSDTAIANGTKWEKAKWKSHIAAGYGYKVDTTTGKEYDSFKRLWKSMFVGYYSASPAINAYIYQAETTAKENQIACVGDSGSPLLLNNPSTGVLYASGFSKPKPKIKDYKHACQMNDFEIWGAWNASPGNAAELKLVPARAKDPILQKIVSNWAWARYLVQTVCKVVLKVGYEGSGAVNGYVSGSSEPSFDDVIALNDSYACDFDAAEPDCIEFIHHDETAHLTAVPDSGWRFDHWEDYGETCACAGSTDPQCTVPYDMIGYYDEVTSWDESTCVAIFVPITCGDSIVDAPEEECDDGQESPTCDWDCTFVVCGDESLNEQAGEECDDGNTLNGDGCSSTCQIELICGDEELSGTEQCDDGMHCADGSQCWSDIDCTDGSACQARDGDGCSSTCEIECGNGTLEGDESCDDGNTLDGDGCSSVCQEECGNGVEDENETCDDFLHCSDGTTCYVDEDCATIGDELCATRDGDGCSSSCQLECGNGVLDGAEECDDGNLADGDGCSSACLIEVGTCGDGNVDPGEACDDGGIDTWDCNADCTTPECGDGYLNDVTEQCDDGNTLDGDGCSSFCDEEPDCGNGILDAGEECDDGNDAAEDGCYQCVTEYCGDFWVQEGLGEECDDGNTVSGDGCSSTCTNEPPAACGDGILDPDEDCDDGNTLDGDGCSAVCTIEECGNGVLENAEECDDGNVEDGDGCSAMCTIEVCGNGVLEGTEGCDDGNTVSGDGCSSTCTLECISLVCAAPPEGCSYGTPATDENGCQLDCGALDCSTCGDTICDPGEDEFTCPQDCTPTTNCGDGICDAGEDSTSCPTDCGSAGTCGDGIVNLGEECDDGNTVSGDGCSSTCTTETSSCGNGVCDVGEDSTSCPADCGSTPVCGDGVLDAGEECDDGNTLDGDGCSAGCTFECVPILCAQPPTGCTYGTPTIDENGCQLDCGPIQCP